MKSWTLLDQSPDAKSDVYHDKFSIDCGAGKPSASLETLHGGRRDGVQLLTVSNGLVRIAIIPQRGMNLWKAWLGDWSIGWNSPVHGPVNPRFVPVFDPNGLGWLEGFDELMARCGLTSNGAPQFDKQGKLEYPLHGRISNLPAHKIVVTYDPESTEIAVTGVVDETRFHFQKLRLTSTLRTRAGESGVRITDEVTNMSGEPGEMELIYHTNFGPGLLEPGAQVILPLRRMAPRDAAAVPGVGQWDTFGEPSSGGEQCYYFELLGDASNRTQTLLRNKAGDRGIGQRFSTDQLPCYTLWKDTRLSPDGYVTGLEPGTNFPSPRSFELDRGRVRKMKPGETKRFDYALEFYGNRDAVAKAESEIARLQAIAHPEISKTPQADICPPEK